MSRFSRRNLLKAAAGTAVLGFPAIIRAQQKEVVILGLWDQTGAFADVRPLNDRGMRMALEARALTVKGRPVNHLPRDGPAQADSSTRRVEAAIDGKVERLMIGPCSSGAA